MSPPSHTAPSAPKPHRPLSRGLRSLAVLTCLGALSIAGGVGFVSSLKTTDASHLTAEAQTLPVLAATLVSADDLMATAPPARQSAALKPRETLIELVTRLGAEHGDANAALAAVFEAEFLDPRRLRPGLEVEAWNTNGALSALSIRADADRSIFVTRTADGWHASELKARLIPRYQRITASIDTSIYNAALAQGAGDQQVVDFAQIFAYDIDFQREIHPGDQFEIVYESFVDERGSPVKMGDVIYAALDGKALNKGFYRFTPGDDPVTDYFDAAGESATKFLMKTPINGARLSSSFGKRRHPISGYTRLHKGTDFAAPRGTPIYAAGHGTVERASRYGGYGHYVRIRHANGYKTAYAHMSRYGSGVKKGRRVRQGQVIGYVGSTGASTGPHLHYEVYINGKPVNAMNLKLPTGRKLANTPEEMTVFSAHRDEIDALRASFETVEPAIFTAGTPNHTP